MSGWMDESGFSSLAGGLEPRRSGSICLGVLCGRLLTSGQSKPKQAHTLPLTRPAQHLAASLIIHGLSQWALCLEGQKRREFKPSLHLPKTET